MILNLLMNEEVVAGLNTIEYVVMTPVVVEVGVAIQEPAPKTKIC